MRVGFFVGERFAGDGGGVDLLRADAPIDAGFAAAGNRDFAASRPRSTSRPLTSSETRAVLASAR